MLQQTALAYCTAAAIKVTFECFETDLAFDLFELFVLPNFIFFQDIVRVLPELIFKSFKIELVS